MGQFHDEIPEKMIPWIKRQKVFWVASAPLNPDGHVNVSPKGVEGTFHIVNSHRVWYEDLTGSGIETVSHLRENGRITLLFNAFEGAARIVRLFGRGSVYEFGTPEYNSLVTPELRTPGSRAAIVIDVHKVGTSCGWGVPLYQFVANRTKIVKCWKDAEDNDRVEDEKALRDSKADLGSLNEAPRPGSTKDYWAKETLRSLDGLPGLLSAHLSPIPPVSREVVMKTISDVVKDEKPATVGPSESKRARLGVLDIDVILAFLLGIVVTVVFMKLQTSPLVTRLLSSVAL